MSAIPWFGPFLSGTETEAIAAVIASGYLNDGAVTKSLEREFAAFLGARHAIAVTSGTAAITLSLMAAGVGPGHEVIVPDLTFIATANAVRLAGADVRLVDVEPRHFTIDVDAAAEAVTEKTRAIVSVDVNGRGADYEALEALCSKKGLTLICDSAEALGSRRGERFLGTFGQAGCFSFSANKTVTSGQGGMIVTNDERLHDRLRELKDQGRRHGGTGGDDLHPVLGFNFKYTNLQAAVALSQFQQLESRLQLMASRDRSYRELLQGTPGLHLIEHDEGEVLQWFDVLSHNRKVIERAARDGHFGVRPFWLPLHKQQPYFADDDLFPQTSAVSRNGLWLSSHLSITRDQIETVASAIKAEFGGAGREQAA